MPAADAALMPGRSWSGAVTGEAFIVPEPFQWESRREIAAGVLITSCVFSAAVFIPVFGFFCTIFIPLPILFYRMKFGRQTGQMIGMISAAIMIMVFKAINGLSIDMLFFAELLLLGFMLSEQFDKGESIEKAVGLACASVLGSMLAVLFVYSLLTQTGMFQLVSNYVAQNLKMTLAVYKSMGISPETLSAIEASFDRIQYTLVRIIPALATAGLLIVAWSNLLMAKPLFKKWRLSRPDFENLDQWRTPEMLIWTLIGSGLAILIPVSGIRLLGINGIIVLLTIYFFQGVAIVAFMFEKKGVPRMLRVFIYSMIALQQILLLAVIGLGVFDMWLDFRKLNAPKS